MTDELKPCLAHPCDGVMETNLYDASLTCSKCQFQVADESEYVALVAGRQAAIDAALESVARELDKRTDDLNPTDEYENTLLDTLIDAYYIVRSRIGTNPLAERDARISELESLLEEAYADADDVLRPRIEELERENEILKTIPMKYRRMGFNAVLQDKIEELERELAEARKDAERWRFAKHRFTRAASVDMSGGHTYTFIGRTIGRGLNVDEAIDAAMLAEREKE